MSFRRLEFRQKTHVRGFAYFPKIPETDRCGASYFKSQMDKFTYFYFQKKLVAVKIITGKLSETCVIVFSVFRVRAINRLEHGGVMPTPITI